MKEVRVKAHTRKTKSGKTVTVKAHTAKRECSTANCEGSGKEFRSKSGEITMVEAMRGTEQWPVQFYGKPYEEIENDVILRLGTLAKDIKLRNTTLKKGSKNVYMSVDNGKTWEHADDWQLDAKDKRTGVYQLLKENGEKFKNNSIQ